MLIAPTEPLPLKRMGQVSSVPERHGVDVLWVSHGHKHGVQRKEAKDFIASVNDGRLAKEVAQIRQLAGVRALVLEGKFIWSTEGMWMGPTRWDRYRHRQALFTLQSEGLWVIPTESLADTVEAVAELEKWTRKAKHSFARSRSGVASSWGTPTSREFGCHLLQGLPNVGPELAERIYDHFGGVPWHWSVDEGDLVSVEGVGKVRARSMLSCLLPRPEPVLPAPMPEPLPEPSPPPAKRTRARKPKSTPATATTNGNGP